MGTKIVKFCAIVIAYVFSFGVVCPWLISYKDDAMFIGGIVTVVLSIATIPTAITYILNLFRGKK